MAEPSPEAASVAAPPPLAITADAATFALPGARSLVAAGFELLGAAQPELRRASVYIGLLTLIVAGPAAVFVIYLLTRDPESLVTFFGLVEGGDPEAATRAARGAALLGVLVLLIVPGLIAISIEAENIGVALLAARQRGRPMRIHEALRRSRQSFWRVVMATFLLSVIPVVLLMVGGSWIADTFGEGPDASAVVSAIIGILLGTPFAYVATGIVIGDVGPIETFRRSVRLARARPRLALVIALFATAVSVIETFATGAGGDALIRIAEFLHLDLGSNPLLTIVSVLVILAGVVALGSLIFTISAVAAAPQVVAFLGLTHHDGGLEQGRDHVLPPPVDIPVVPEGGVAPVAPSAWMQPPARQPLRYVSWPMLGLAILAALVALAGLGSVPTT